jgi:hypothetical protein
MYFKIIQNVQFNGMQPEARKPRRAGTGPKSVLTVKKRGTKRRIAG